jgi:hypothetical protein
MAVAASHGDDDDHLYLLTLCLELQLDLLLVALRPGSGVQPRWVNGTLDLTGEPGFLDDAMAEIAGSDRPDMGDGDPVTDEWLMARYKALTAAVDEMLVDARVQRRPDMIGRLVEARGVCEQRLAAVRTRLPVARSERIERTDSTDSTGRSLEAGHFLG